MYIHIQVEESKLSTLLKAITEAGGTVVSAGVDVRGEGVAGVERSALIAEVILLQAELKIEDEALRMLKQIQGKPKPNTAGSSVRSC